MLIVTSILFVPAGFGMLSNQIRFAPQESEPAALRWVCAGLGLLVFAGKKRPANGW
ncbi:MAG: hypothetical protein ABJF23_03545 [Bryobacteraceae bacterium]